METLDHPLHHVWIMQLLLSHAAILFLLCHLIVAETRVLGIRILPFPSVRAESAPTLHRQLIIRCDVTAYPPVDAENNHWFYENERRALETGQKYTIYKDPTYGVVHDLKNLLTIHGVTSRQLGTYTCHARNSAGMAGNATVTLRADAEDNILIENDDYLLIDSRDNNDQLETLQHDVITTDTPDDDVTTSSAVSGHVISGRVASSAPLVSVLVASAIAVVHTRRYLL